MPSICPTITAYDTHEYRSQMERIEPFAKRVHIDLMDGEFAPTTSPALDKIWWPPQLVADIHLMYQRPMDQLKQLIKLQPNLVVIHYEAEVDHLEFAAKLQAHGIKAGLAVLHDTPVADVYQLIQNFDHVLVFSGNLGHHGGEADLGLLDKVRHIREHQPLAEIGWDGGIDAQNVKQLVEAGVSVLNVGGFIQQADKPQSKYEELEHLAL